MILLISQWWSFPTSVSYHSLSAFVISSVTRLGEFSNVLGDKGDKVPFNIFWLLGYFEKHPFCNKKYLWSLLGQLSETFRLFFILKSCHTGYQFIFHYTPFHTGSVSFFLSFFLSILRQKVCVFNFSKKVIIDVWGKSSPFQRVLNEHEHFWALVT